MATILQQPDQYSFAGNIKNIIVTTEVRIIFKLKHGSEVLFESSYDPDLNDKVEIDIKKIIQDALTSDIPGVGEVTTRDFSSFSFIIDEGAEQFFYAFEGGVDTIIDSSWFAENFLTWQPQTSYVTWSQPQFLSYIALQVCNLKIKGYFSDGTDQTVSFGAFTANKINTANLQFSSLPSKFASKQPQYVDVWTEDAQGARLSYIQRFVLKNSSTDDNSFLFKNSLGGWDSVVFSGTLKNEASSDVKTFSQEDTTNEYQVDLTEKYSKNTGYFLSEKHRIWISEFFKTSERYYLSQRGYFEKLTVLSSTINSVKSNPSSYNFTFSLSRTTKYLNLPRVESPESPLEIVDPTGDLFFLAPRLIEFPSAEFVDEFLLPVQSPYLQEWKKITLGVVKGTILDYIRSQISPGIPQSLLDLSDIDPSLEMANVGAYMVKLASGKWGPGSVSIDLSNYFNKGESDERYSFKSHSHDYVPTATFNSHTGDSVKHTTQEDKDKIIAAYNDKHTHNNKANLDTINQDLSKSSSVEFADLVSAGSVAFYGGTGGGSTPASSLLNLSDIDSSLATAAVGSPLVKLANGKWGPGSVSIDLTNYFTKEESDARFAFKSHSHDYVAPSAFNAHTGDTTKHITSTERVAWNAKESALGNPDVDGKILASTAGGVRSWVNRYVLPLATAAMLGGVIIGSNVNVDAQGRISVAAPYSHPATHPASMIDESATRRFLTDAERANWNDSYDKRHTHGNKANLDSINQNLSQTSNVKFNDMIADGSIGFYGGVGSGSTPVASLLDLSDIDASISGAATGTPLVKLANGKWGAGSVSIDLSNYYNKSDADARYAFKSHSHDYVTTSVFNGHNHNGTYALIGGSLSQDFNAESLSIYEHINIKAVGGKIYFDSTGMGSSHYIGIVNDYVLRLYNGRGSSCTLDLENSGTVSMSGALAINGALSGATTISANALVLQNGNNVSWGGVYGANIPTIAGQSGVLYFYPSGSTNGQALVLYANNLAVFSSSVSAASFTSGGNAVLHAGNYTSYALPLSGGTLSGSLTITGTLNTASAIISNGSGSPYWLANQSGINRFLIATYADIIAGGSTSSLGLYNYGAGNIGFWSGGKKTLELTGFEMLFYAEDDAVARWASYYNYASNQLRFYSKNASGLDSAINLVIYDGTAYRGVIHAGNIGSQSVNYAASAGNADTLDGYHYGYFSPSTHEHSHFYTKYSYPNNIVQSTMAETLSGAGQNITAMFDSPSIWGGYANAFIYTGYNQYGSTQIITRYNAPNNDNAIAFRVYNQSIGGYNNWTEIWTKNNLTNTLSNGYLPYWNGSSLVNSIAYMSSGYLYVKHPSYSYIRFGEISGMTGIFCASSLGIRADLGLKLSGGSVDVNTNPHLMIATTGNVGIGYTDRLEKLAVFGNIYANSYIESASYLKGTSVKLGTWEIKENASGELEFIQSGVLKFKGTSAGLISQGELGFYS